LSRPIPADAMAELFAKGVIPVDFAAQSRS
jgi:hypothetical protein